MKRKCDKCDQPATHHCIEIIDGQKVEKHMCDDHAQEEFGHVIKPVQTPINELLTSFVKMHSGIAPEREMTCPDCGLTYSDFQERSLLGCSACYTAFESVLAPLFERAHEGGVHHLGKSPRRAGSGELRQATLTQMRKRLTQAIESEDYELAATLRDEIVRFEELRT